MHSWKTPGLRGASHLSVFRYLQKLAGVSEEDSEDAGWWGKWPWVPLFFCIYTVYKSIHVGSDYYSGILILLNHLVVSCWS